MNNSASESSTYQFAVPPTQFSFRVQDCVEGMRSLPDGSVDVVVTSPPYNLGIEYSRYRDRRDPSDYFRWTVAWATEVFRVLKETGSFFLNLGACPSEPMLPHELLVELKKTPFVLQNTFHWIKSISIRTKEGDLISAGHFKPIQSERFVTDCHEYVFHLTKTGKVPLDRLAIGVPYMDKSNIARWDHTGGKDKRCRGNNWFIPYQTILSRSNERPHPATFPAELAEFCLKIHGLRAGMTALDPFLGIGHAALAAKTCQIAEFVGFDIDPAYVKVARARLVGESIRSATNGARNPRRTKKSGANGQTTFW